MINNSSTFCAATWFHLRNESTGEYNPCCLFRKNQTKFTDQIEYHWPMHTPNDWLNSPYMQYVRESLSNNQKLPECNTCWHKEQHHQQSLRQTFNQSFTLQSASTHRPSWMNIYFKNKKDLQSDTLISADVKLTNVCNFSCVMCNPADSSQIYTKWTQNIQHPVVRAVLDKKPDYLDRVKETFMTRSNHSFLKDVLSQRPKFIKLLGGEPLLDRTAMDILANLSDQQKTQTRLMFITNGSQDLTQARQILGRYKQVLFVLSLEGIGKVQDYVRRGSVWSDIQTNIDTFISQYGTNSLSIHHTLQALTVLHLPELLRWSHDRRIPMSFDLLDDPTCLSLQVLPDEIKDRAMIGISTCHDLLIPQHGHDHSDINIQGLISILKATTHRQDLLPELEKFLKWYDPQSIWVDIVPEWQAFLK